LHLGSYSSRMDYRKTRSFHHEGRLEL
jgi:hypothetical protein